uniref:Uncharacterized protein n=1 Tax=viral metagenome TaxID=1070528 RepID=A0A6M3LSI4_9ZZZZ
MENKQALSLLCPLYPNGHNDFIPMCLEEMELHSAKNADYAKGGDPLGNFKRVSAILKVWGYNIPPYLVALIYALKQQDAYMWMLSQGYEGQVEGVASRLQDDSIYKKLVRILYNEARNH